MLSHLPSIVEHEMGSNSSSSIPWELSPIPCPLCLVLVFDKDLTEAPDLIETHPRCPWRQTSQFPEGRVKVPVPRWGVVMRRIVPPPNLPRPVALLAIELVNERPVIVKPNLSTWPGPGLAEAREVMHPTLGVR